MPRPGVDAQGTLADEKAWLRQWTDQLYLWYREVPASDPATFPTALAYFDVLKTMALTPSGNPKDRFHFTIPTAAPWIPLRILALPTPTHPRRPRPRTSPAARRCSPSTVST